MSSRIGVVPTRSVATTIALAVVICLFGTFAAAQVTIQPKDEISAGYAWLHPAGHYDLGIPTKDNTDGVDISIVHYLGFNHNLGLMVDSSMHWGQNYGGPGNAGDYYVLG